MGFLGGFMGKALGFNLKKYDKLSLFDGG